MKSNRKLLFIAVSILAVFILAGASPAVSVPDSHSDKNLHGFVIQVRSNKHTLTGAFKTYIRAEDLGPFFGVNIRSIDGGKAAMIGHLYYDKNVKPYNGSAFLDAQTFFNFFGIQYTKFNDWTYRLTFTNIPMFNQLLMQYNANGSIKLAGSPVPMEVLTIRDQKYAELETLLNLLKVSKTAGPAGTVNINGKRVDRWLSYRGKTFVYVKDAALASGKAID